NSGSGSHGGRLEKPSEPRRAATRTAKVRKRTVGVAARPLSNGLFGRLLQPPERRGRGWALDLGKAERQPVEPRPIEQLARPFAPALAPAVPFDADLTRAVVADSVDARLMQVGVRVQGLPYGDLKLEPSPGF